MLKNVVTLKSGSEVTQDKRRFPLTVANFSHSRVFIAPGDGVTLGIRYQHRGHRKLE